MHADLSQRAAVAVSPNAPTLPELVLEDTPDRRTAIVDLSPGAAWSIDGGPSLIDAFVVAGTATDGRATYAARTYVRTVAPVRFHTTTGCRLFLKQRARGEATRAVVATDELAFSPHPRPGLTHVVLHEDAAGSVGILVFSPGTVIASHDHDRGEEFFVLEGSLADERGVYGVGHWVRQPPGSVHAVRCDGGCRTLVFAHHL